MVMYRYIDPKYINILICITFSIPIWVSGIEIILFSNKRAYSLFVFSKLLKIIVSCKDNRKVKFTDSKTI